MAADIGIEATTSLDEAFAQAMERHGPDAKVIVLPFARYQLPRNAIRMQAEEISAPRRGAALGAPRMVPIRSRRAARGGRVGSWEPTERREQMTQATQTRRPCSPACSTGTPGPRSSGSSEAFGFVPHAVHQGEDGAIVHAELLAGQSIVMLGSCRTRAITAASAAMRPRVGVRGRRRIPMRCSTGRAAQAPTSPWSSRTRLRLAGLQRPRSGGKSVELRHVPAYPVGMVLGPRRDDVRGSMTIVELLRRYPNGEAARLMSRLAWPCAHCGGAFHEPLTMAAKRHRNSPRAVLDAFRTLDDPGGPSDEQVARAAEKHR